MLSMATLSMGALISAGCGDDETTGSGGSGNSTADGGSTSDGGSSAGGSAACTPSDECETCAAEVCMQEALDCCMATGCQELVRCGAEAGCAEAADQVACTTMACPDEIAAGAASIAQAQALAGCLGTALENPPAGACTDCAALLNAGGGGAGGN